MTLGSLENKNTTARISPDRLARGLRVLFDEHVPKRPVDPFFLTVWELRRIIQEQCGDVPFLEAEEAIAAHFPELFADYWDDYPFEPYYELTN